MGAVLSDAWLAGLDAIDVIDQASVSLVRQRVRESGEQLGLAPVATASLVNVASELANNQLAHARRGQVAVRAIERDGVPGLELIAADQGVGIASPSSVLRGGPRVPSTSDPAHKQSLGIGLSAVIELSDEVDFDVRIGEGTCVWARKFGAPVRRRREVGIYGRPCPGELISGDDAGFVRSQDALLLALADGLGHGQYARIAADAAIGSMREFCQSSPDGILLAAHAALHETRGAVMALSRLSEPDGAVESANVGNVTLRLCGPARSDLVLGSTAVLGARGARHKPSHAAHRLGARDTLVMFSDGLSSRLDLQRELSQWHDHPIIVAHELLLAGARNNDDALVMVAR